MAQFNLLPDVKLQFVKARRTKYLMTFISFIVGAAALGIMLFSLFVVHVIQKQSLTNLDKDIKKYSNQLQNTKDLDKILTVQNQLDTLPSVHEKKQVVSRLFGYIGQVTPTNASINKLSMDTQASTLTVGGAAASFDVIKLYASVFKGTEYTVEGSTSKEKAFSEVVLTQFAPDEKGGTTYTITMKYNPAIFDVNQATSLIVPKGLVTNQAKLFGTEN